MKNKLWYQIGSGGCWTRCPILTFSLEKKIDDELFLCIGWLDNVIDDVANLQAVLT